MKLRPVAVALAVLLALLAPSAVLAGPTEIQKLVIAREKIGRVAVQYSKEARAQVSGANRPAPTH